MEIGMMIDMAWCREGTTYYKTEFNIWENVSSPFGNEGHQLVAILSQHASYD